MARGVDCHRLGAGNPRRRQPHQGCDRSRPSPIGWLRRLPERVATLASVEAGTCVPPWAAADWPRLDADATVRALAAIAVPPAPDRAGPPEPLGAASPAQLVLEESVCRLAGPPPAPSPADTFWHQPLDAVIDDDAEAGDATHRAVRQALLLLASQREAIAEPGRVAALLHRFGVGAPRSDTGIPITVAAQAADGTTASFATRLPASALAITLTGLVTRQPSSGTTVHPRWAMESTLRDPDSPVQALSIRLSVAGTGEGRLLAPRVLNDLVGGRVHRIDAMATGDVLVTPNGRLESRLIDERGHVRPGPAWPRPIIGETAYLGHARLAWTTGADSQLMLRHGERVTAWPVPFVPCRALVRDDGVVVFSSGSGAWTWHPDRGFQRRFEASCYGVHVDPGGIRLDPMVKRDGRRIRTRVGECWITRDLESFRAEPLGPLGPCWHRSLSNEVAVETFPHADTVRLRRGGETLDVTCYYPLHAAFAGRLLVVSTMSGDLLTFEDAWPGDGRAAR